MTLELGSFGLVGLDSGKETRGVVDAEAVSAGVDALKTLFSEEPPKAAIVLSHASIGGKADGRLVRELRGFLSAERPVVFLQGHVHPLGGTLEESQFGPWPSFTSIVNSLDPVVGHLLTITDASVEATQLRRPGASTMI